MKNTTRSLTLIMLGLQGSGKGTQAQLLVEKYDFSVVEMGKLIRDAVKNDKLSEKDKQLTIDGKLISIEGSVGLIKKAISELGAAKTIIIDGFPRSMGQLHKFIKLLNDTKRIGNYTVIDIMISEKTAIERSSTRWMCKKCGKILTAKDKLCSCGGELEQRKDDKPEIIKNRIKFVSKNLDAIKSYFRRRDVLIEIDGEREVNEIFSDIESKLGLK